MLRGPRQGTDARSRAPHLLGRLRREGPTGVPLDPTLGTAGDQAGTAGGAAGGQTAGGQGEQAKLGREREIARFPRQLRGDRLPEEGLASERRELRQRGAPLQEEQRRVQEHAEDPRGAAEEGVQPERRAAGYPDTADRVQRRTIRPQKAPLRVAEEGQY